MSYEQPAKLLNLIDLNVTLIANTAVNKLKQFLFSSVTLIP